MTLALLGLGVQELLLLLVVGSAFVLATIWLVTRNRGNDCRCTCIGCRAAHEGPAGRPGGPGPVGV